MFFLAGDPDITPITTLITTWIHIRQALVASIGALSFILPCRGFPHWGTECRPRRAVDILSAEIASEAFKALPNSVVGTSWVLVPATHSPSGGQSELEFRTRDGVVGRERRVSRVLYPLRDGDHLSGMPVSRHL